MEHCVSFDDILIIPQYSEILPSEADVSSKLSKNIQLNTPIISAAMDRITNANMAIAMALTGGIGAIHKNFTIEEQVNEIRKVKNFTVNLDDSPSALVDDNNKLMVIGVVGTAENELKRAEQLIAVGANAIIVDTAHGHSAKVIRMVDKLKKITSNSRQIIDIIAGNIVTVEAAKALIDAGADGLKIGIGPGSICTTRIVAGVGIPQFSAIQQVSQYASQQGIPTIADGGIKNSGDIAKAIAAGAHSVMIGSLLAKAKEAPGSIITINGKQYKQYRGMGSLNAMIAGSKDRYFQHSQDKTKLVAEGVEGLVEYKCDTASSIIHQLSGGLRAAMGYTGNKNIELMRTNCKFVQITNSGIAESNTHSIILPNS